MRLSTQLNKPNILQDKTPSRRPWNHPSSTRLPNRLHLRTPFEARGLELCVYAFLPPTVYPFRRVATAPLFSVVQYCSRFPSSSIIPMHTSHCPDRGCSDMSGRPADGCLASRCASHHDDRSGRMQNRMNLTFDPTQAKPFSDSKTSRAAPGYGMSVILPGRQRAWRVPFLVPTEQVPSLPIILCRLCRSQELAMPKWGVVLPPLGDDGSTRMNSFMRHRSCECRDEFCVFYVLSIYI